MARRRDRPTGLPAPFLKRISLKAEMMAANKGYPFDLPWLREGFVADTRHDPDQLPF